MYIYFVQIHLTSLVSYSTFLPFRAIGAQVILQSIGSLGATGDRSCSVGRKPNASLRTTIGVEIIPDLINNSASRIGRVFACSSFVVHGTAAADIGQGAISLD